MHVPSSRVRQEIRRLVESSDFHFPNPLSCLVR